MKIACHLFAVGVAALFSAGVAAQTANSDSAPIAQQTHTFRREVPHKVDLQYLLFLPKGYDKSANDWPLILYLHGGSARGDEIGQMKKLGLTEKVEGDPNFPFIVVSPQCHKGEIWTDVDALDALLDEVARTHPIDPNRIYVTGHSMGGRGALYAAYKMPARASPR